MSIGPKYEDVIENLIRCGQSIGNDPKSTVKIHFKENGNIEFRKPTEDSDLLTSIFNRISFAWSVTWHENEYKLEGKNLEVLATDLMLLETHSDKDFKKVLEEKAKANLVERKIPLDDPNYKKELATEVEQLRGQIEKATNQIQVVFGKKFKDSSVTFDAKDVNSHSLITETAFRYAEPHCLLEEFLRMTKDEDVIHSFIHCRNSVISKASQEKNPEVSQKDIEHFRKLSQEFVKHAKTLPSEDALEFMKSTLPLFKISDSEKSTFSSAGLEEWNQIGAEFELEIVDIIGAIQKGPKNEGKIILERILEEIPLSDSSKVTINIEKRKQLLPEFISKLKQGTTSLDKLQKKFVFERKDYPDCSDKEWAKALGFNKYFFREVVEGIKETGLKVTISSEFIKKAEENLMHKDADQVSRDAYLKLVQLSKSVSTKPKTEEEWEDIKL